MTNIKPVRILVLILTSAVLNESAIINANQQEEFLRSEIKKLRRIDFKTLSDLERSRKLREINEVASLIEKSGPIGIQVLKAETKQEIEEGRRIGKFDSYFLIGAASLLFSMTPHEMPLVITALLCSKPESHLQPYFLLAHRLARLKDPRIIPVFEKLFKLKDAYIAAHAQSWGPPIILTYVYGVYGEDGKRSALNFLNDSDPNCRYNAVAMATGLYLDRTSEQRLTHTALYDPNPRVRALAIEFLPDVACEYFTKKEKRIKKLLENATNDESPLVAQNAVKALSHYEGYEKWILTGLKKGKKLSRDDFESKLKELILSRGVGIGAIEDDLLATVEIEDLPLLCKVRENILQRISDEGLADYNTIGAAIMLVKLRSYAKD